MKSIIIVLSILLGLILPFKSFHSMIFFLSFVTILFIVGLIMPFLININSLSNKIDNTNVTVKNNISIHKSNTISFWLGVFICLGSIISLIKHLLLRGVFSELAIFIFVFGLGILINLLKRES